MSDDAAAPDPARRPAGTAGDDCCQSLLELYGYLDGCLSVQHSVVIETHIAECVYCGDSFAFHAELRRVVSYCCQEEVPDSLRRRIAEALRRQAAAG